MKKFFQLFGFSTALVLSTTPLLAAEETPSTSTATVESSPSSLSWDNFSLFLNAYPLPIISDGIGLAAEYHVTDRLSLWAESSRATSGQGGDAFWQMKSFVKAVNSSQIFGGRFYASPKDSSGWFLGGGYKMTEINTTASPDLFSARAAKRDHHDGAYATAGYRFQGRKLTSVQWVVDLGISYAPGKIKKADYIPTQQGLFGAQEARLETEVSYGAFPEARIGLRF